MEGALVRRNRRPLTRPRWKRIWLSLQGSATEGVRGWSATVPVAEYATGKERPSEGFRSRAYRSEQGGSHGKPGDIERRAKAGDSPSSEAPPEVTSFAELRPGERPWKPPSNAKAGGDGDSGIERFTGCS